MKLKTLILAIAVLLFVPSVQAEITNPSFEDGTWTGWSTQSDFRAIQVGGVDGSYHAHVWNTDTPPLMYIGQSMDLTGVDTVSMWVKHSKAAKIEINYNDAKNLPWGPFNVWLYHEIDASGYNGVYNVRVSGYGAGYILLDNVRMDGVGYNPSLSGIVNSSSVPIDGASISIHDDYGSNGSFTAISNETGFYQLTNITPGVTWRIQAAAFDYDEWHENDVTISSDTVRDIEMVYNPTPTEDPTVPITVAIPPSMPYTGEDNGDDEIPDTGEDEDETIIDDIIEIIDDIGVGMEEGIGDIGDGIEEIIVNVGDGVSNLGEGVERLVEPITEPVQNVYEEVTHTSESSSFIFILFAYFGALVASLLLFYSTESEIDVGMILLSGTIGWILLLLITFSGIMNLVFAEGIISGFVYAIFGFVVYVVMNQLSGEETGPGRSK